jgi:hypothetical protein
MSDNDEKKALNSIVELTEMLQEQDYVSMSDFFDDLFKTYESKFNTGKIEYPHAADPEYTGIHLGPQPESNDLRKMINSFKEGQMIHAVYALQILSKAITKLEECKNINKVKIDSDAIIVGDLHGSLKDLCYIIDKFDLPGRKYTFVFNGDIVDRGPYQCEVLLIILYSFILYPRRVFINRGLGFTFLQKKITKFSTKLFFLYLKVIMKTIR